MSKPLVKLPRNTWVNPRHVTCIELTHILNKTYTDVWVVKNAGYGTGSLRFAGDIRDQLAAIINQDPQPSPR